MHRWSLPSPCTRAGASHRRQGIPCQDASETLSLRSLDDRSVLVMAVADGHGGRNYPCSDVGSRLACERALAEISGAFLRRPLGSEGTEAWGRWLQVDLPRAIHASWIKACRRHWEQRVREAEERAEAEGRPLDDPQLPTLENFHPYLYGTTLGVVVMTPFWWGHTGLGDWDLCRVYGPGEAELVSEEPPALAEGESTASLSHERAWELFASRTALHPLRSRERPFALVLSTDGIRKSCPGSADFLSLSEVLVGAAFAEGPGDDDMDLPQTLDRITEDGSGDDVSVAVAVLGRLRRFGDTGAEPEGGSEAEAAGAQEGAAGAQESAAATGAADAPGTGRSLQPRLSDDEVSWRASRPGSASRRDDGEIDMEASALPWPKALLLVVGVIAVAAPFLWRVMQGVPSPLAPELGLHIQDELVRLCRGPNVMRRNLRGRREVFEGLVVGRFDADGLQADAARDPLAALIASSFDPVSREMRGGDRIAGFEMCPELRQALTEQWSQAMRTTAGTGPPP